jgi:hypothetical protein
VRKALNSRGMTSDSMPLRESRTLTQPMRSNSPECRGPLCQGRRWPGLRRVDAKIAKETRNFRERPDALLASSISGVSDCSAASARWPLWAPHLNWPVVTSDRPSMSQIIKPIVQNCQRFRREPSSTIFASVKTLCMAETRWRLTRPQPIGTPRGS